MNPRPQISAVFCPPPTAVKQSPVGAPRAGTSRIDSVCPLAHTARTLQGPDLLTGSHLPSPRGWRAVSEFARDHRYQARSFGVCRHGIDNPRSSSTSFCLSPFARAWLGNAGKRGAPMTSLQTRAGTNPYATYHQLRSIDPVHRMRLVDAWATPDRYAAAVYLRGSSVRPTYNAEGTQYVSRHPFPDAALRRTLGSAFAGGASAYVAVCEAGTLSDRWSRSTQQMPRVLRPIQISASCHFLRHPRPIRSEADESRRMPRVSRTEHHALGTVEAQRRHASTDDAPWYRR